MNGMLAVTIEVTWTIIATIVAGIGIIGASLGFLFYKAWSTFKGLKQQETDNRAKIDEEEDNMRENLLRKYKEMYELEKERATREIQELRSLIDRLKKEVEELTARHRHSSEEYDKMRVEYTKVVELNIRYQEDKRRDQHEIKELKHQVKALEDEIRELKKDHR